MHMLAVALAALTAPAVDAAPQAQGFQTAQAVGYECHTSVGVCPLAYPLPLNSPCTCPGSSGPVAGVVQ